MNTVRNMSWMRRSLNTGTNCEMVCFLSRHWPFFSSFLKFCFLSIFKSVYNLYNSKQTETEKNRIEMIYWNALTQNLQKEKII